MLFEHLLLEILFYTMHILVISPTLTDVLQKLFENSVIKWCKREFQVADVQTASLIIVATNDSATNKQVIINDAV